MKNNMKKLLTIAALLIILTGCGNRIEQYVAEDSSKIICKDRYCLVTAVWYDGEIVHSVWDAVSTITDSIKDKRKTDAELILKTLKK